MTTDTKRLVPKRRFEEFVNDGDWERRKLTDFADFYNGLTYSPSSIRKSGTLVLRSSNVRDGEVTDADNVYVDSTVVNCPNVCQGDIIIVVRNGSRALIGKHAQIKYFMPNTVVGAFMTGARSECPEFLNALLDTPHFAKEVAMNMGATINQITGYMFSTMEFMIPRLEEQTQIGTFFKNFDHLITLQHRKLEKVRNLKSAYLSKMFPKDGEKYPELRFSGFTDAWEQRKLSELANFTKGRGYTKSDLTDSGSPIILYGRLYTNYETMIEEVNTFVDGKENSVISLGGEVLVPSSGESAEDIARAAVVGKPGIILGGDLNVIKPAVQIDPVFLALAISSGAPNRDMEKRAQGKSVVHLHNSDLKKINLVFPQIEEQRNIVALNLKIDNLITLHQRKLDKLKSIKQAYLNEMFV